MKEHKVINRNQVYQADNAVLVQIDDSMDICYVCGSDRDPHLMMICDLCDFMVAHTYCCGFGQDFPEDWLCRDCEALDVEDSSFDEEEDSYDDESEEVSQEVTQPRRNLPSRPTRIVEEAISESEESSEYEVRAPARRRAGYQTRQTANQSRRQ